MIGLLQCDHVLPEFARISGDYDDMFRRWLPADWRVYDVTRGERPDDVFECDAYVSTGSRASVYDREPWLQDFASLVRTLHEAQRPLLGVCFGHQMIAHALGGLVTKCVRGWSIGVHTFEVAVREPWMEPPVDRIGVLMSCQDQVERLPPGATVLAGNEHCPVGMFRVGSLLGLQGHPEFSVPYAQALAEYRRDKIGDERMNAARSTLGHPTHSELIRSWAEKFLSGNWRNG
jgi:GMP synthase-like glutamine amidotransferase